MDTVELRDVFEGVVDVPIGHNRVLRTHCGDDFLLLGQDALQSGQLFGSVPGPKADVGPHEQLGVEHGGVYGQISAVDFHDLLTRQVPHRQLEDAVEDGLQTLCDVAGHDFDLALRELDRVHGGFAGG